MKALPRRLRGRLAAEVEQNRWSDGVWLVAAFGAPLLLALALRPAEDVIGVPTVTLVLVVPVVVVAAAGRWMPALAAAVAGTLAFDYLYTDPRGQLVITYARDAVATAVLLAVGVTVVLVARWGRRQAETASRTVSGVAVLRTIVELMTLGEDDDVVLMHTAFWLRDLLALRDCRYDLSLEPPSPARLGPGDEVRMGDLDWPVETAGLPGPSVDLPLLRAGVPFARFVLVPTPGRTLERDRLFVASAVADLVATWLVLHRSDPPPDLRSAHG